MEYTVYLRGDPNADTLLVQMVDDHDMEMLEKEIAYIKELSGGQNFCLKAVKVNDWNKDLSPWPAPAVFGKEDFGAGAPELLSFVLREVIPETGSGEGGPWRRIFLGGYSLAGLFALWAGYHTSRFDGIAAASPSVWFPNFTEYVRWHELQTNAVYLSLGDREEKTKNPVMAKVGDAIRADYDYLRENGTKCILEWNEGNHFKDADLRTAKAFAWLMNREV